MVQLRRVTCRAIRLTAALAALVMWPSVAVAQAPSVDPCPPPAQLPPADSPPLVRCVQLVAHPVNEIVLDWNTYQYHIKMPLTESKENRWAPYNKDLVLADFWNLWNSGFLDNLWVEVIDEPYENGVMGKHVVFHIEERSRVKIVDYVSADSGQKLRVDVSKIEETLRDRGIQVRLDAFVDDAIIRRVRGVIRELHTDEGYLYASVEPSMRSLPSGPKLVHLTFTIDSGPKVQIREIDFEGNEAFTDGTLRGQMKENKPKSWLSFITSAGTYYENKFADDAQKVEEFYHNKGHARVRVGSPQVEVLEDTDNGRTRWIRLVVPVDEGPRYRIGTFEVTGQSSLRPEFVRTLFSKVKEGDHYSRKNIDKGIEKAQEAYGSLGFYQWVPNPLLNFRDVNMETGQELAGQPPVVDINMEMREGTQFFVHRIKFLGNTTTHDSVIRREMRVAEGGVFSTTALKDSIRRLNQLGYFKPLEDAEAIQVTPTANTDGQVDIALTFEEQNRNQISFGAGVSQFDGFFGQLGYQTSNFLGRGETVAVNLQKGAQASNYQVSFSEPYMFDRPLTVGVDVYKRQFIFPLQYTQASTGTNLVVGYPVANFARTFLGYNYEEVTVKDINPIYLLPEVLDGSPFLRDSLLLGTNGRRTVSKISPSLVYNTIDHPIFPTQGRRLTVAFDIAGLGGNTSFVMNRLEGVLFLPLNNRVSAGFRLESQYIRPYGQTKTLPIFERFFLGGEYNVRGFDIRTIGPRDESGRIVIGGNKTLVFNAELLISVVGPVRLVAFYDAGQVRDLGQNFGWWEPVTRRVPPPQPLLSDPFAIVTLTEPGATPATTRTEVIGRRNAFKTSTGVELRFFMPVLNVPFRLIAAYNPQRGGVLNNSLLPQPRFTFRFAVGTTF